MSPIRNRDWKYIGMKAVIARKLARQHPIDYVPSGSRLEGSKYVARPPWQVEDDEQGHNRDGDVSHVDLLGVPVGPPLVKEHDPLADSNVQNHQDRDRSQSRRDKWVKLRKG